MHSLELKLEGFWKGMKVKEESHSQMFFIYIYMSFLYSGELNY